jgi:hypothetical protein
VNGLASRLRVHPEDDLSLAVGGVTLAVGTLLAFSRIGDVWADFPVFLLIGVPTAVLFALALVPGSRGQTVGTRADGRLAGWQTAFLLVGLPLLAGSILQLLAVLGKNDPGSGTFTWVLLITAACAALIGLRLRSPGATLLAALFFGIAALTAVNWIDSNAQVASYRDVLLVLGALYLLAARTRWDQRREGANLLVAVAGAALLAGATLGNGQGASIAFPGLAAAGLKGKDGWELVLVAVTIGLLVFAAWQRHGGSAVVGLIGFYLFFLFTSEGNLGGWPIVLGVVAVGALVWALVVRPSRRGPTPTATPAPEAPPT